MCLVVEAVLMGTVEVVVVVAGTGVVVDVVAEAEATIEKVLGAT